MRGGTVRRIANHADTRGEVVLTCLFTFVTVVMRAEMKFLLPVDRWVEKV